MTDPDPTRCSLSEAAALISQRWDTDVTTDMVLELAMMRYIAWAGRTDDGHQAFNLSDLDNVSTEDIPWLVKQTQKSAREMTLNDVAAELGIRLVDARHLVRAGIIEPRPHRKTTAGKDLFHWGMVESRVHKFKSDNPNLDWGIIQDMRPGMKSLLATLPTYDPRKD